MSTRTTGRERVYEKLEGDLRESILNGTLDFDVPIPGEMELCEKYDISRKSVRKALDNLAAENLLEKVQGKGTFAVPPDSRIKAIIGKELNIMLVIPWFYMTSSEYDEELINGVSSYVARAGHKLEYSDHEVNVDEAVSDYKKGKLDGIIWGRPSGESSDTIKKIIASKVPVVTINRDMFPCHSVSCDTDAELEGIISFLYEFNHRKIAFVNRRLEIPTHKTRKAAFFNTAKSFGLPNPASLYTDCELSDLSQNLRMLLREQPTALIVGGHFMLGGVLNFCRKNKIKLPADLSLISINDGFMARNYSTPVSA
jgi:DNA-binding LacI/PurR family transcriptional regulator